MSFPEMSKLVSDLLRSRWMDMYNLGADGLPTDGSPQSVGLSRLSHRVSKGAGARSGK